MYLTNAISQRAPVAAMRCLPRVAKNDPKSCARRAKRFTNGAQVLEVCEGDTPRFSRRLRARLGTEGTCVVNRVFIAEQIRKNYLDNVSPMATGFRVQHSPCPPLSPPSHRRFPNRGGWKPPLRVRCFILPFSLKEVRPTPAHGHDVTVRNGPARP